MNSLKMPATLEPIRIWPSLKRERNVVLIPAAIAEAHKKDFPSAQKQSPLVPFSKTSKKSFKRQ